jgi:hypothetical protein
LVSVEIISKARHNDYTGTTRQPLEKPGFEADWVYGGEKYPDNGTRVCPFLEQ